VQHAATLPAGARLGGPSPVSPVRAGGANPLRVNATAGPAARWWDPDLQAGVACLGMPGLWRETTATPARGQDRTPWCRRAAHHRGCGSDRVRRVAPRRPAVLAALLQGVLVPACERSH